LSDTGKIERLARAIVSAFGERQSVCMNDLLQSGVARHDAERLYDRAFERACHIDPAIVGCRS
jgi:hypothetical protein